MSAREGEFGEDYNSSDDEDYVPPPPDESECLEDGENSNSDENDDELVSMGTEKGKKSSCHSSQIKEDPEEKKKRIDSLWLDFLSADSTDADTQNATSSTFEGNLSESKAQVSSHCENQQKPVKEEQQSQLVEEIFNFAGEDVKINRVVPVQIPTSSCSGSTENNESKRKWNSLSGKKGGLSAAANLLSSKRKKLSVLDKSNHDWQEFVQKEGITEDLSQHNKSKDSYLDKQDFLLKADVLQFQKEKALRKSTRK